MLKLKFNPNLDYQIEAINSVVKVFEGQIKKEKKSFFGIIGNELNLDKEILLNNIRQIQKENNLSIINDLSLPLNITVEMETGTGKTYVYLRTIFELNKQYGFLKFIIVAPSIAIKEGIIKTLEITKDHFKEIFNNINYEYYEYDSSKLINVRMFAQAHHLQIMIMTKDSFNKDLNIIHNIHDRMGDKPINLIQKTRPILILDEPQKMEGEATQWGIKELNPLFILRYSATHKNIENLVYKLTPFEAYQKNIVKKIELATIVDESDPSTKKIILENIYKSGNSLRAKLKVFVKEKNNIKLKLITVRAGDKLWEKTKNDYYNQFIISEINSQLNYVLFSNGVKIYLGQSSIKEEEITRIMIKETIKEHFEKKKKLNPLGIKVLTLFFIRRVDDYAQKDSWLRKIFEEEYQNIAQHYKNLIEKIPDAKEVHKGYFSTKSTDRAIEKDKEAYDLIMKDKEKLLSFDTPVEFIFSHSALREGWDNPNIFNICTLSYSTSEIKKRQEIGRGLRLAVNQNGERIYEKNINLLTVISNESYSDYISKLQTEFYEEVGEKPPPIELKKKRVFIKLKEDIFKNKEFIDFWNIISKKSKFIVNLNTKKLIEKAVEEINKIDQSSLNTLKLKITKAKIESLNLEDIRANILSETIIEKENHKKLPNIISLIEKETKLTKKTILSILTKVNNFHLFFKNPFQYLNFVIVAIKKTLQLIALEGICYLKINDRFDFQLFNQEIQTYEKYIIKLNNKKTIYQTADNQKDVVIIDPSSSEEGVSQPEKNFSLEADKNPNVLLFFKLPDSYYIETPAGKYTPDWALLIKKEDKKIVYFITETKGTNIIHELKEEEQIKILSAKVMFNKLIPNVIFKAPIKSFDNLF